MPWWVWIIIFVFVGIFIAGAMYVFGEKQNKKEKILQEDTDLLEKMTSGTDLLVAMSNTNITLREKVESLQENLKYCLPSDDQEIYKKDLMLSERISDLKLSVSRAVSKDTYHSVMKFISEIELLIIERNSLLKK